MSQKPSIVFDRLNFNYVFTDVDNREIQGKRNSILLLRMHQTLIFEQDVAKSKDARRVREP